jgi:peptidoglycan/LPS O-acetylase OafA/YrhL
MILSIQYLRGIAALLVLLHHVAWKNEQYGANLLGWFHIGEAGVDIFFVVSGFVMCHTTRSRTRSLGTFARHRFVRIMPLYWIMTCMALAVFLVMPGRVNSSGGHTDILASFLLLPSADKYLVQVGWTLAYEFYFYVIFAVGLLFDHRRGNAIVLVLLVSLAAIGQSVTASNHLWHFLTSALLLEFAAGMLLYRVFETAVRVPSGVAVTLIAMGAAILVVCNQMSGIADVELVRALDYGSAALLIVGGFVLLERRIVEHPVPLLRMLGDSSYSLYLSHVFVLGAFALVLAKLPRMVPWTSLLVIVAMLVAAAATAVAIYRLLEHPLTRALRGGGNRVSRNSTLPGG